MHKYVFGVSRPTLLLLCLASSLGAQQGVITGTVFDSVTMRPVVGAAVQAVPRSAPTDSIHAAMTDSAGRYELSLAAGVYLVGFQHEALDSLGVTLSAVSVEARGGERVTFDMAVPPPRRIVATVCGKADEEIGAIFGFLRDARTGNPLDSGSVEATWHELLIRKGALKYEEVGGAVRVRADGWFAMCGVPPDGEAFLIAKRGRDSTGAVLIRVPPHGLVRRDLSIGGVTRVRGSVVTERGPLRDAEIRVSGLERVALVDSAGRFTVMAPAGTQTIEARALGFFPDRRLVNLTAARDTTIEFTLVSLRQMMDTVQVVSQRLYASERSGFSDRRKTATGTYFDAAYVARHRLRDLNDLLRRAPGVRVTSARIGQRITMQGAGGECVPTLYIDRARVESTVLGDLAAVLPVIEVEGLEVYRPASVPPEFSSPTGCGVIVLWTRPPQSPSKH